MTLSDRITACLIAGPMTALSLAHDLQSTTSEVVTAMEADCLRFRRVAGPGHWMWALVVKLAVSARVQSATTAIRGLPHDVTREPASTRLIAWLREHPGEHRMCEIARSMGLRNGSVDHAIRQSAGGITVVGIRKEKRISLRNA